MLCPPAALHGWPGGGGGGRPPNTHTHLALRASDPFSPAADLLDCEVEPLGVLCCPVDRVVQLFQLQGRAARSRAWGGAGRGWPVRCASQGRPRDGAPCGRPPRGAPAHLPPHGLVALLDRVCYLLALGIGGLQAVEPRHFLLQVIYLRHSGAGGAFQPVTARLHACSAQHVTHRVLDVLPDEVEGIRGQRHGWRSAQHAQGAVRTPRCPHKQGDSPDVRCLKSPLAQLTVGWRGNANVQRRAEQELGLQQRAAAGAGGGAAACQVRRRAAAGRAGQDRGSKPPHPPRKRAARATPHLTQDQMTACTPACCTTVVKESNHPLQQPC